MKPKAGFNCTPHNIPSPRRCKSHDALMLHILIDHDNNHTELSSCPHCWEPVRSKAIFTLIAILYTFHQQKIIFLKIE